ncbi:hypothetical protein [Flavobacterium sp. SM2513]|uniref:hypothetical protein n=1 Tax=Flavobacterium sp. SM2513 TaxID=3424766 RepID=UPI003D7F8970
MKKIFFATLILFTIVMNYSCSSDDDGSSLNNNSIATVISTMNSGTWKVTKYIDGENDESADFSGYDFTFTENNILMAKKDNDEIMGSWLVATNSSNNGSSTSDLDFIISFSGPEKFLSLTDDWDIKSSTGDKLELIDVSGGNGGTDYLTFEKN